MLSDVLLSDAWLDAKAVREDDSRQRLLDNIY
jgi:hypothetical protein